MGGIKNQCRSYNPAPSAKTSSINLLATKMSQKNFVLSKKYVLALNIKSRLAPSNCKVLNFDHVLPPYNLNEALINFVKQFLQASIFSCQDDQEQLEKHYF